MHIIIRIIGFFISLFVFVNGIWVVLTPLSVMNRKVMPFSDWYNYPGSCAVCCTAR